MVGYSAGGVVARYWVQDLGGRAQTRRLVTLGSPHHGTEVAELGTLVRRRLPGRLPAAAALPARCWAPWTTEQPRGGPRVVSIWTTQDDVVLPPDSARLAGALNLTVQSVCPASQGAPLRPAHRPARAGHVVERPARAPARRSTLGARDCRPAQLVMSLVAKLAQAAPSSTTT